MRLLLVVAAAVAAAAQPQPPTLSVPPCALGAASAAIAAFANGTATGASPASQAQLCSDDTGLTVTFAFGNDTAMRNDYAACNSAMYNQEVGELFIAPGVEDPRTYIEIEVTPFGALFVNKIENPTCDGTRLVNVPIDCAESGIAVAVSRDARAAVWTAKLHVPFSLFDRLAVPANAVSAVAPPRDWRANLFRVRMRESVAACSPAVCDYLCWSPTWTSPPKFHHCDAFAHLSLSA